jgi:hypothetical protein
LSVSGADRAGYEDDPIWKAERAAESNWTRPRPSSVEIARMEAAIVWPARYLSRVPQLSGRPARVSPSNPQMAGGENVEPLLEARSRDQ